MLGACGISYLLLAAGTVQQAFAHTSMTNFFIDGVDQGKRVSIRRNMDLGTITYPIKSVTGSEMACGIDGEQAAAGVVKAKAGSTIQFEFHQHPDGDFAGEAMDPSHKGPCAIYMKKVDDAAASNNAAGPGWFKIWSKTYDDSTGKWCTEEMMSNGGHISAQIPDGVPSGNYLVRSELLALHSASANPADPQFYVGCAQIDLTSSAGSNFNPETVSIPGYVDMSLPALTFDIYTNPIKPYPAFGPAVFGPNSGGSGSGASTRGAIASGSGASASAGGSYSSGGDSSSCAMKVGSWCATALPSYTDKNSCLTCYNKCTEQTSACTSSGGDTSSCNTWTAYCQSINTSCSSGAPTGPPALPNGGTSVSQTQGSAGKLKSGGFSFATEDDGDECEL